MRVSNSSCTDQAQRIVGAGLVPKCVQRLSADDKSKTLSGKAFMMIHA